MYKRMILMTALILSGCETVGNKQIEHITAENISEWIVVDLSDKSSVFEIFGDPLHRVYRENDVEVWLYAIADLKPSPVNYVPVVGTLNPQYRGQQKSVIVTFGADGLVDSVSVSYSDISLKRGIPQ